MDLITEHADRWRTFEVDFYQIKYSQAVFRACNSLELTLHRLQSLHLKNRSHYGNIIQGNIPLPPWKTNGLFDIKITDVPIDWTDSVLAKTVSRFELKMTRILNSAFRITWSRLARFLASATKLTCIAFKFGTDEPVLQFSEQTDMVDSKPIQRTALHSLLELDAFLHFSTFTKLWPRISGPNLKRLRLDLTLPRDSNDPHITDLDGLDSLTHLVLYDLYFETGLLLGACHIPHVTYLDVHIGTSYDLLWVDQIDKFDIPSLSVLVVRLTYNNNLDDTLRFLNMLQSPNTRELTLAMDKPGSIDFYWDFMQAPLLSTLVVLRAVKICIEEALINFFLQMHKLEHLHLEASLSSDGDFSLFSKSFTFEDIPPTSNIVLPCLRTMSLSYIPEDRGFWEVPESENESIVRVMKQRYQIGKPITTLSFNGKISETLMAMFKPYVRCITSDSPLVSLELEAARK